MTVINGFQPTKTYVEVMLVRNILYNTSVFVNQPLKLYCLPAMYYDRMQANVICMQATICVGV
jgi:hypothetical protein